MERNGKAGALPFWRRSVPLLTGILPEIDLPGTALRQEMQLFHGVAHRGEGLQSVSPFAGKS
jgi:hypothetical protein